MLASLPAASPLCSIWFTAPLERPHLEAEGGLLLCTLVSSPAASPLWSFWLTAHLKHPLCVSQNLCFTKKIRYESRKQLAQARPRIKGQFVRMPSGGEADLAEVAAAACAGEDASAPSGTPLEMEISEGRAGDTASPSGVDAAVGADFMADAEEVSPAAVLGPQPAALRSAKKT